MINVQNILYLWLLYLLHSCAIFFPNVNYLFFFSTFVYPSGEAGGVFFYDNDLPFFGPIPSMFCLLHIGQCKSVWHLCFLLLNVRIPI